MFHGALVVRSGLCRVLQSFPSDPAIVVDTGQATLQRDVIGILRYQHLLQFESLAKRLFRQARLSLPTFQQPQVVVGGSQVATIRWVCRRGSRQTGLNFQGLCISGGRLGRVADL